MDTITREPTTVGEMLTKEFYDQSKITPERLAEALNAAISYFGCLCRENPA